jgi:hypothetical protein
MGFSISWVAVQGKPKSAVLDELGLRETGGAEFVSDWPMGGAELPNGWYLLFLNDLLHPFTEETALSSLSKGCYAVTCQVEEHVMASAAFAYRDGKKVWDVTHESELGKRHLLEHGQLPTEYTQVRDRLLQEQDIGDREEHGVDYVWDVPVTLAYEVVGYRHDNVYLKSGGEARFVELVAQ